MLEMMMAAYAYIAVTIATTVLGQLLMKKGMLQVGKVPGTVNQMPDFFFKAFTNPFVAASLCLAVITAAAWMAALSKSDLSFAYPFMSLAFALVVLLSALIFNEQVSITRFAGIFVICLGIMIIARS